jgi:flagellar basal-body rod modification protein FlgD
VEDTQNRFLKLLVTQMQNQDPLNPLDNAQVTSQMAQLSTVTGIDKLNSTLSAFSQSQAYQAAGIIGHQVLASGSNLTLSSGAGAGGYQLDGAADTVKISIFDGNGNLVRNLTQSTKAAGVNSFAWDGKNNSGTAVADGNYTFTIAASQAGQSVTATNLAYGNVNSVLMDSSDPTLNVTGLGNVSLSNVKQIL